MPPERSSGPLSMTPSFEYTVPDASCRFVVMPRRIVSVSGAKCASDAETLGRAQQLLGHADSKITERVYRRKPEVVRPLR
jgi:hypothetical protein